MNLNISIGVNIISYHTTLKMSRVCYCGGLLGNFKDNLVTLGYNFLSHPIVE